ncbi:glycosyltransferase [Robbsia sp. KACC 23696]|uniref:glycosyltransferase n=1 Tax=Robbsia sp. KACC 23696 TaxID=3149231 RepID=UPI00325B333B
MHKDVVQIPMAIAREDDFQVKIVTATNSDVSELESLDSIQLVRVATTASKFLQFIAIIAYLLKNARLIDVLNLYHSGKPTMIYVFIYKFINQKGFCYIKLDLDHVVAVKNESLFEKRKTIPFIFYFLFSEKFKSDVNLFSIESIESLMLLRQKDKIKEDKCILVRNGVSDIEIAVGALKEATKEKLIVQVGRIGTYQKNTELFLDAIPCIFGSEWRAKIVGPISKDFENIADKFFRKNPLARAHVEFVGSVNSREEYYKLLASSRIFCQTSRWEGTPLVIGEAAVCGNLIISTDVSGLEMVRDGRIPGLVVCQDDVKSFREALEKSLNEVESMPTFNCINTELCVAFSWNVIVNSLLIIFRKHFDR